MNIHAGIRKKFLRNIEANEKKHTPNREYVFYGLSITGYKGLSYGRMKFGSMIKWLSRIGFVLVFAFEIANYFGLLHFTLDYTWLGLIVTMLGASFGIEIADYCMRRSVGVELPWLLWPVIFGAVFIDVVGDVFSLYSSFTWFDQVAHFLGTAAPALVFYVFFHNLQKVKGWRYPVALNLLLAFGLAMALGAFYEIEEYVEDFLAGSNRLGDGQDTANDLLLNTFGAISMLAVIAVRNFFRPTSKQ